jgi:hypothetical protein
MSLPAETSTSSKGDNPFRMALQIKLFLVENSEASTLKVHPQSVKHGISYKRAWFGQSGKTNYTQKAVV